VKLLLLGKNGQVGHELQNSLLTFGDLVALDHSQCDLAQAQTLRECLAANHADVIINAAAYTAVDKAESEPALAQAVNADALAVIGRHAAETGALVIHYSTDYVFDGRKTGPYNEDDVPQPLGVYGATKLAGEQALAASGCRHLIFRTSWVYGVHGGNFAKTILRLAAERDTLRVVADQQGAPTSARLIAEVTARALAHSLDATDDAARQGLYHLAADGVTTWHEYACAVVDFTQRSGRPLRLNSAAIAAISTADYPLPAQRPANSCLDCSRLKHRFSVTLPHWRLGLEHTLAEILRPS
jgi:dTDP-4-dehydrorhamnose reductase